MEPAEAPRSGGGVAARRLALLQAREEAFSEEGVERAPSRSRSRQRPRNSPSSPAEDNEEAKKLHEKLATANERIKQLEAVCYHTPLCYPGSEGCCWSQASAGENANNGSKQHCVR